MSTAALVQLCLGLEIQLGRPMLEQVYLDACQLEWQLLVSLEERERPGWNLEPIAYTTGEPGLEEMEGLFDSAYTGVKKTVLDILSALGVRAKGKRFVSKSLPDGPVPEPGNARSRVRKP